MKKVIAYLAVATAISATSGYANAAQDGITKAFTINAHNAASCTSAALDAAQSTHDVTTTVFNAAFNAIVDSGDIHLLTESGVSVQCNTLGVKIGIKSQNAGLKGSVGNTTKIPYNIAASWGPSSISLLTSDATYTADTWRVANDASTDTLTSPLKVKIRTTANTPASVPSDVYSDTVTVKLAQVW